MYHAHIHNDDRAQCNPHRLTIRDGSGRILQTIESPNGYRAMRDLLQHLAPLGPACSADVEQRVTGSTWGLVARVWFESRRLRAQGVNRG